MPTPYSPEIISHIHTEIVPHITAGARDSLAAYEQGMDPDADRNFFSNYMIGCSVWDNIYNRILHYRITFIHFDIKVYRKIMEIFPEGNPTPFYISRVGEDIRIPKAGRSIKRLAQEQLFLCDDFKNRAREKGIFYLGYNIDGVRGLGDITLELLTHVKGNTFQAETLHSFRAVSPITFIKRPAPEQIAPARPARKQASQLARRGEDGTHTAAAKASGGANGDK